MKCSITRWTVTATAAALLALAPAASAQTTPPTTPPADQQPATQAPVAEDHLRQAKAALADVQDTNLSTAAKRQVAELKRRMAALERPAANWGVEVAAMDKVLSTLLGAEVPATGTTGTTGKSATKGKAAATVALDDTSRTKLMEVRTHLTSYAAAKAGTAAAPAPAPASATPATSSATETTTPATTPAQPPAAQVNQEEAKRHLTEARNTLSALTQLPNAAQLTGEARTQVSQLISNFNELITTTTDWRAAYAKVSANMTSLLGPETTTPPSATAGAVGTSGTATVTLDPAVREKLVEMRKHLLEFERASGGTDVDQKPTPANPTPATPSATPPTPTPTPLPPGATPPAPPTGTQTGSPRTPPTGTPTPQAAGMAPGAQGWMQHLSAIDAMLKSTDESGGLTLDKAKVEMLRTHVAELRKLLERK